MRRARRWAAAAAAALAVMAAASCAPRLARPPQLAPEARAQRYQVRLQERLARATALTASVTLWAEHGGEPLPGAQGEFHVAAPNRMRLRIASPLGTALDVGLSGDSLRAYVPAWRTGLELDAAAESLGVSEPGGRVVRALCATWQPPAEAWAAATWEDSLMRLDWAEGEDSLRMAVGSHGLPAWVELARGRDAPLRARYRAWETVAGVAWPSWVELGDERGRFRLTWRTRLVRFQPRPDPARLAVRWPARVSRLTLADLRAVFDRLGGL